MKILLQRVSSASVSIGAEKAGAIAKGLLLYTGFGHTDTVQIVSSMASKVANLRVFADKKGRFQYSLLDADGAVLVIPQFTLYADTDKGRRPEFLRAMHPQAAAQMFDRFAQAASEVGIKQVESGRFGADMQVESINDGPVTIMLTSEG